MSMESNFPKPGPKNPTPEKKEVTLEDVTVFGESLRIARGGISFKLLAEKIGVNGKTLSHWEQGDSFPEESRLKKIAEVYKINFKKIKVIKSSHSLKNYKK